MKFSPGMRYAIRLLFELHGLRQPASAAYLSEKTGISLRTVESTHSILRRSGITSGTVGARGGIMLIVPLATISLGQLVSLFDNGVEFTVCCGDKANECPDQETCAIRAVWNVVSVGVQTHLDGVFLDKILDSYPEDDDGVVLNAMRPRSPIVSS